MQLVVTMPFAGFEVGDRIVDPALVKEHMDSSHVVRVDDEAVEPVPTDMPKPTEQPNP